MITPACNLCGEELIEPGALIFGPPTTVVRVCDVPKIHVCVDCYEAKIEPHISARMVQIGEPEVFFGKIVSAVIDRLVAANVLSRSEVESGQVELILDAIDDLIRAAV